MPVEIDHGLIALIPYLAAEMPLDICQGSGVHLPGSGGICGDLPVQHDGHIQFGIPQNFQHKLNLLVGFLDIQRLGEEVGTNFQARFLGILQIGFGVLILHQLAAFVAPVAQTDDGKIDAGLLHLFPVDVALESGNIHAGVALHILQQQVVVAVILEVKPVIRIPLRGNGGVFRFRFRHGGLQIGFQRGPGELFRLLLVQQSLRILFRQRRIREIVPAHQQNHAQQDCCRGSDDSQNPLRAKTPGFAGRGGKFFRDGVRNNLCIDDHRSGFRDGFFCRFRFPGNGSVGFGVVQFCQNIHNAHGLRLLLRTFDSVYHIFPASPSGEICLKKS